MMAVDNLHAPGAAHCIGCGNRLSTLAARSRCPACGAPTEPPPPGRLLWHADGAWLARVHLGLRLLMVALFVAVLHGLATSVATLLSLPARWPATAAPIVGLLTLLAVWSISRREPDGPGVHPRSLNRLAARLLALLLLAGQIILALRFWLDLSGTWVLVATALQFLGAGTFLLISGNLRRFARRSTIHRLATPSRWAFVSFTLALAIGATAVGITINAATFATDADVPGWTNTLRSPARICTMACGGAGAVFGLWALIVTMTHAQLVDLARTHHRAAPRATALKQCTPPAATPSAPPPGPDQPNDAAVAAAHNRTGMQLARAGKLEPAAKHYLVAIRARPDCCEARYNLANCLVHMGKLDHAIDQYEKVLRLRPDFPQAHYNLGVALERIGNRAEAAQHYRQALSTNPDHAKAQRRLAAIGKKKVPPISLPRAKGRNFP